MCWTHPEQKVEEKQQILDTPVNSHGFSLRLVAPHRHKVGTK